MPEIVFTYIKYSSCNYLRLAKVFFPFIILLILPLLAESQSRTRALQKTWIRTEIVSLSDTSKAPNTRYERYTFTRENLITGNSPAWNGAVLQWSFNDPVLTIWHSSYIVEELTDSTLVFYEVGRARWRFVSETQYSKRQQPDTTESFDNHAVYVATKYLTPRYKKEKSLYNIIFDRLVSLYPIKQQGTFIARFVVTDQGKIARIRIVNAISQEHSDEFIKQIQKTSGDWFPAKVGNVPVYSEVTFGIRYAEPLNPSGGNLSGTMF